MTKFDEHLVAEVLDAEDRRNRALHNRDWDALTALLADDLTYTHLSGRVESKDVYLAGVQDRAHAVQRSDLKVQIFDSTAVMTGKIAFGIQGTGSEATSLEGVALQVWVKRNETWQMVALQATRTTPPS